MADGIVPNDQERMLLRVRRSVGCPPPFVLRLLLLAPIRESSEEAQKSMGHIVPLPKK